MQKRVTMNDLEREIYDSIQEGKSIPQGGKNNPRVRDALTWLRQHYYIHNLGSRIIPRWVLVNREELENGSRR